MVLVVSTLPWSAWMLVVLSRTVVRIGVVSLIATSVPLLVTVVVIIPIARTTVLVVMTLTLSRIRVYWTIWIRALTLTFFIIVSSI
ncbi:hypothetical protein D3C81_1602230 [compost metagenome]